jgi:hypothetical protein
MADLAGVEGDLSLCIKACDEFIALTSSEPWRIPTITQEALAEFAIFRYCRTIATEVRSGVRADQIAALPPNLLEAHRFFKDLRDKHLAHSVNYHEQNSVHATISLNDERTLLKLGTQHSRTPATAYEDIKSLKELAEALGEIIETEDTTEFDATWDLLESMTPEQRWQLSEVPKAKPKFRATNAKRPKVGGG